MILKTPTSQQLDFFEELKNGKGHVGLVARAGTGKTTTIVAGVDILARLHPRAEITVAAYNKPIADEVKARLLEAGHTGRNVNASTLHSMGFGLVRFAFPGVKVDDKKVRNIIDAMIKLDESLNGLAGQIEKLVSHAKNSGVGFFSDLPIDSTNTWADLADRYDVNGFDDEEVSAVLYEAAKKAYRTSHAQTSVVDFDDMILFPLIKNLRVKYTKDYLFLDEAQDLSRIRQALARKFVNPRTGRLIIVGDDKQAIYAFSGADSEALPNMIKQTGATVLPLSVTWRCPRKIVELAQTIVPDIQAAPGAAEGEIIYTPELPADLTPGRDVILCRNTAPLVTTAYSLIRRKIPAKVEGRAIGEGLIALARRWKVKTISALLTRLEDYREREMQKANSKGNETKAAEVDDRVSSLEVICKECLQADKQSIQDVVSYIEDLFADEARGAVILATYHRSKGREWPRVILFEHHQRCPSRAARQEWQKEQETNLAYVAFTRAKETLVFLDPSAKKAEDSPVAA